MKDGVIQSSYRDSQYTTLSEVMRLYLIIMGTWGERTPQAFSTFHPPIPIPIILYSLAPELLPSWVTLPPKREARECKGHLLTTPLHRCTDSRKGGYRHVILRVF